MLEAMWWPRLPLQQFPELFAVFVPTCTYEGDNAVLQLQVAGFLMKTITQIGLGKPLVATVSYMSRLSDLLQCTFDIMIAEDWLKPTVVLETFDAMAARMSVNCA